MRFNTMRSVVVTLALSLSLGACEDSSIAGPEDGKASLAVYLTDAPGDVEAVWLEPL